MSDDKASDRRHSKVADLLPEDWDREPFSLMTELRDLLSTVKDVGTSIDSGSGDGYADLWVTVGGVEYYITARRSNNQLTKEGKPLPASK